MGGDDFTLNITWPYYDKSVLTDRMNSRFLPEVDEFLEKAVPYTTDVTVSCANWDMYAAIDLFLMQNQGRRRRDCSAQILKDSSAGELRRVNLGPYPVEQVEHWRRPE